MSVMSPLIAIAAGLAATPADVALLQAPWPFASDARHVAIARRGAVRLDPAATPFGVGADGALAPALCLRSGDGEPVRVLTTHGGVRLLVYVDTADLGGAVVRPARLRSRPDAPAAPGGEGIELAAGTTVEVLEEQGAWRRVRLRDALAPGAALSGWVEADALGWDVVPAPFRERETPEVAEIVPGARVLVRPGGPVLTTLPASDPKGHFFVSSWDGAPLGAVVRGHRQVEIVDFCPGDHRITGWVAERDVVVKARRPGGGGCGTGGWATTWGTYESAPRVRVQSGRWLLSPTSAQVIGFVREDTAVATAQGDDLVAVPTAWGPAIVRLAPAGFSPGPAPPRSQQAR